MAVAIGLWSVAVTPGEPTVVKPEGDIRITNCALGDELVDESRNTLKLSYMTPGANDSDDEEEEEDEDDDEPSIKTTILCSLTGGKIEQASTDVILEEGQEYLFEIVGKNTIYVTGNYIDQMPPTDFPPYDDEDEEDDYDLRDIGSDNDDDEASVGETDASRFEEVTEEPKSAGKRPRASDAMETDDAASDKKAKKLKGADGEAAPAPEGEKLSKKEKKKKAKEAKEAAAPATEGKSEKEAKELAGGVKIKDAKTGTGPQAKSGNTVSMRYIGKLQNGHVFDKNTKGKPFTFKLGGGEVIKGWDVGIVGMQVGGERLLTIPPGMAYGKKKSGDIPPNSTLTFEVKLLEIK